MAEFTKTVTETVNCPGCGGDRVIKNGNQSGQQRYQCKACKKQFRANGKSTGRRVPDEQTGGAIHMYYGGMSYKQIGETVADLYGIPEPSKATVYEWVRDYSGHAVKEMANHPAQVGDTWVADEMQVVVGGQKMWNWNVVDEKTRYILASYLSKERDTNAARAMLRKAKANTNVTPGEIKTDKLRSYLRAIREELPDTKHVQSEGLSAKVNNNLSERLQGTFRQRTKTMRGLESRETGQRYLDGWVLDYNLFREHESLGGKTPGEVANVNPPFKEWADVVRADLGRRASKPPKSVGASNCADGGSGGNASGEEAGKRPAGTGESRESETAAAQPCQAAVQVGRREREAGETEEPGMATAGRSQWPLLG